MGNQQASPSTNSNDLLLRPLSGSSTPARTIVDHRRDYLIQYPLSSHAVPKQKRKLFVNDLIAESFCLNSFKQVDTSQFLNRSPFHLLPFHCDNTDDIIHATITNGRVLVITKNQRLFASVANGKFEETFLYDAPSLPHDFVASRDRIIAAKGTDASGLILTQCGNVYACGESFGISVGRQSKFEKLNEAIEFQPLFAATNSSPAVLIGVSYYLGCIVFDNNEFLIFGSSHNPKAAITLQLNKYFAEKDKRIINTECSDDRVVFLTERNELYIMTVGYNTLAFALERPPLQVITPMPLPFTDQLVTNFSVGDACIVIITNRHKAYIQGYHYANLPTSQSYKTHPLLFRKAPKELSKIKVSKVSTSTHNIFITPDQRAVVYNNTTATAEEMRTPQFIQLEEKFTLSVCTTKLSLLLTEATYVTNLTLFSNLVSTDADILLLFET